MEPGGPPTSKEFFRLIVESVEDYAVFMADLEGRLVSWNPGVERLLGYSESEFVGLHASIIFPPEDRELRVPEHEMETALSEGSAEDRRWHMRRDGSRFWANGKLMLLRDEGGGPRGFAKILRDDTERKLVEDQLRHQLVLTETITGSLLEGIHVLDGEGRITFTNQAAQQMLGWTAEELLGRKQHETIHSRREDGTPYPAGECPITGVIHTGIPVRDYETVYTRKDGSQFPVLCTSAPRTTDGQLTGAVMTFHDISARRRAESGLRESEERFRTLSETAADVIVTIDDESRILFINAAAEKVFGYRPEELVDQSLSVLMPEYLRHLHRAGLARYLETGRKHITWDGAELPGLHKSGREIALEVSFGEFRRGDRHIFTGIARDITERKRAEGRDRFLAGLNQALLPLADPGDITAAAARMLGEHLKADRCAYAEVEADEDHFLLTGDYTSGVPSIVGRFSMSQFGAEALRLMRANEPYVAADVETDERVSAEDLVAYRQTQIRAVVSVPLHKAGKFVAGMAIHQKVPRQWSPEEVELVRTVANRCWEAIERARAARELRESEERYRSLLENANDIIYSHDLEGNYLAINRACEKITGHTREEILGGLNIAQVVAPDHLELAKRMTGQNLLDPSPTVYQIDIITKDGRRLTLEVSTRISHRDGRPFSVEGIARDVTERKRAEEEKARLLGEAQEANRLKDEFLATLSHELRTPLTAILGWVRLLQADNMDADQSRDALGVIERNARVQTQLIDDLLDVSRIITGKLRLNVQPVDLSDAIRAAVDTLRPAAEAKKIRLQMLLDPSAGHASGDPDRLQQVVWNLVSNAIRFTPKGGRVQVRLERVDSHVEIVVSDTGRGIEPDFLPHVFDRFRQADQTTTRQHGGLGLGLAIVRQLVDLHGGTVHVASGGEGQGAAFTVRLPLLPVRAGAPAGQERVHPKASTGGALDCPPQLNDLRVLIVDDEEDTRKLFVTVLTGCGAFVTAASSTAEALEVFRRERPDIIVSDIGMPEADGYALIRQVRALPTEQGGNVPAVALTAYARSEDRMRALMAGFQVHLPKPVEPSELAAVVASLAGRTGRS